jgi:hypothetical protein
MSCLSANRFENCLMWLFAIYKFDYPMKLTISNHLKLRQTNSTRLQQAGLILSIHKFQKQLNLICPTGTAINIKTLLSRMHFFFQL